jgi:phage terminase small subunit
VIKRAKYTQEDIDRFISEYMTDLNARQAAFRCGFSDNLNTCGTAGWSMLQRIEVKEEINRRIAEKRSKNVLTVDRIEGLLRDIAETELTDIFDDQGRMRPLSEMPDHARKAIKSIETKEDFFGNVSVEIKLWDKKGAIELLGKYRKMFTDKVELGGEGGGPVRVNFVFEGIPDGRK